MLFNCIINIIPVLKLNIQTKGDNLLLWIVAAFASACLRVKQVHPREGEEVVSGEKDTHALQARHLSPCFGQCIAYLEFLQSQVAGILQPES